MEIPIIILAGGQGTRLKEISGSTPKPLVVAHEHPFLYYQLKLIEAVGLRDVVLSLNYQPDAFFKFLDTFKSDFLNLKIKTVVEPRPLGTGGALKYAIQECCFTKSILILNGDTFLSIRYFKELLSTESLNCLCLAKVKDIARYGSVKFDGQGIVEGFNEKKIQLDSVGGWIFSGLAKLDSELFRSFPRNEFSLEKELLEPFVKARKLRAIAVDEYFIDIGIPDDFQMFKDDLIHSKISFC